MTSMPTAQPEMSRAERVAAATPASRHRVIDFLRAAAITVVVLGHWTIVAVDPAGIQPHGVLDNAPWSHPLTWVFQVMPVFFLVGGYANGLSWRSARRKGIGYGGWLRARLRRLGLPLIPLLLVWLAACVILLAAGVTPERVQILSQMALIPTWFLAAYLLVIAFAPACLVLWERFGWWSIAGGVVLAGLVDVISIGTGSELAGYPNYLIVWASFHQVGYAWLDGRLATMRRKLLLAGIGAVGLAVLVGLGPYPVSMITAAGDEISNSNPTRVTMAFLGMLQAGLVLLAEAPLTRLAAATAGLAGHRGGELPDHDLVPVAPHRDGGRLLAAGRAGRRRAGTGTVERGVVADPSGVVVGPVDRHLRVRADLRPLRVTPPGPAALPRHLAPDLRGSLRLHRAGRDGHRGHGRPEWPQPDLAAAPGRRTGRVRGAAAAGPPECVTS